MEVSVVPAEECSAQLKAPEYSSHAQAARALPRGVEQNTQICYTTPHHDTCQAVLGSPVVVSSYLDSCVNTVVGVKVFGGSSGPTVYARTTAYVSWIESIVWP